MVSVLQRMNPYAGLRDCVSGFQFVDHQQLLLVLDRLVASSALRQAGGQGAQFVSQLNPVAGPGPAS